MKLPLAIAETFLQLLNALSRHSSSESSINELDQLLESGFRGNEVKLVENMIVELDKIEQETDALEIIVRSQLFAIENTLQPCVMFLYNVIE